MERTAVASRQRTSHASELEQQWAQHTSCSGK